jgi:hypothetical protein
MDSKIVAEEGLLAKVRGVTGPTTLCDKDGNAVAVVMPPEMFRDFLLTRSDARFRPELAERAWQDYLRNGGSTTAEVLTMLKGLDAKS